MFQVIEKWANWDSEKQRVVGEFQERAAADANADERRNAQAFPWAAFVVREVTPNGF